MSKGKKDRIEGKVEWKRDQEGKKSESQYINTGEQKTSAFRGKKMSQKWIKK